ncbi:outer membrane beta-barrel protein [Legionella yabuuchiae]|uniref:outer membrane beta-barrel protein n=1 Tax=Legionella yabuuchiae TaxID=376727 RepID=UPI0010559F56|nr:outer membrane beta-barrel protein [Legionella yabuuchiae]
MKRIFEPLLPALIALSAMPAHAYQLPQGQLNLSLGGAYVNQGQEQLINIQSTFGNIHTVNQHNDTVFLAGAGYFFDAFSAQPIDVAIGTSVYYLSPATVNGLIYLERTFPNLGYQYKTTNVPLYANAKAAWKRQDEHVSFVVDAGVGPNFIKTHGYQETSLDGGVTIPNQAFHGETQVKLSAMAGIGLRLNQVWNNKSLEVGYKYFYLNEGHLNPRPQVLNHLKTGNTDAHALTLTLIA